MELTPQQQAALEAARARREAQSDAIASARVRQSHSDARYPVQSGSIIPATRYSDGDIRFDPNAGVVGAITRALTAPRDAMRGDLQVMDGRGGVTDEAIGRSLDFAALASPVNPGIRSGDRILPGQLGATRRPQPDQVPAPTAEQLRATAANQFDAMRATGAEYPTDALASSMQGFVGRMQDDGFDETVAPRTFQTLRGLASRAMERGVRIQDLHASRRVLGRIQPQAGDSTDYGAARRAIRELDAFISSYVQPPSSQRVLGGPETNPSEMARRTAAQLLQEGNANYAAARRSEALGQIDYRADIMGDATHSGQGYGEGLRRRIASALSSARGAGRSFSPEEQAAIERVARGTPAERGTRQVAALLGSGRGLAGQTAAGIGGAAGATVGGPMGAFVGASAPILAGRALRGVSDGITGRGFQQADEMVRRRSPLFEQQFRAAENVMPNPEIRAAIIRALMAQQSTQSSQ